MKILIINGPNLNLLGTREKSIYGERTFDDYLLEIRATFSKHEIDYFQSNHCGQIIDKIHEANKQYHGMIINAGGYTHTSVSLGDAVKSVQLPIVEVHISNIYKRENFRHLSYLSSGVDAVIAGLGLKGYEMAIRYLVER